jgi:hypothetical protein
VPVLHRDQVLRGLLHDLAAITTTDHTDVLPHIGDGLLDSLRVGFLDLLPLPRIGKRPSSRHRLRSAEHTVDPTTTTTVRTSTPQPSLRLWMATFHQRNEVLAAHRRVGLDTEPFERLRVSQPPAGSLGQLAVGGQVIVATLGSDRLSLQISGVVAATRRRDA